MEHIFGNTAVNNDFTVGSIFFTLIYHTLAIQSPQCNEPITDGIANSLVTHEALCSDTDIPI